MSHPDPTYEPENPRTTYKKKAIAKKMNIHDLSKRFAKHANAFDKLKTLKNNPKPF